VTYHDVLGEGFTQPSWMECATLGSKEQLEKPVAPVFWSLMSYLPRTLEEAWQSVIESRKARGLSKWQEQPERCEPFLLTEVIRLLSREHIS